LSTPLIIQEAFGYGLQIDNLVKVGL